MFNFLKSKESNCNITVSSSLIKEEWEIIAPKGGVKLIDLDGFESPSGGYLNYNRYQVKGINPKTGRMNTKRVDGFSEGDAINFAKSEGLIEPFDVSIIQHEVPYTDYLKSVQDDFEIKLPDDMSDRDLYHLTNRLYEDDTETPTKDFAKFATDNKIMFSRFIGEMVLCRLISLKVDKRTNAILFAYVVSQIESGSQIGDPRSSENYRLFSSFADIAVKDSSIMKYINEFLFDINKSIERTRKAYKTYKDTMGSFMPEKPIKQKRRGTYRRFVNTTTIYSSEDREQHHDARKQTPSDGMYVSVADAPPRAPKKDKPSFLDKFFGKK